MFEIDCQEVLEDLRQQNKDTKAALKQFEDLIKQNESVFEEAMKSLNDSIQSDSGLIKSHIQSTIYIKRKDVRRIHDKYVAGVFVHANWFLSPNQINFIKIKLLKVEMTKDILLCLDEVAFELIF